MKTAIFAALMLAATATHAAPNTCQILTAALDADERMLAYMDTTGVGDDSAPRATMRAVQNANLLAKMNMRLQVLIGAGCGSPTELFSGDGYRAAAAHCAVKIMDGVKRDFPKMPAGVPAECDQATWHRISLAPAS